jgi:hypothetical protein
MNYLSSIDYSGILGAAYNTVVETAKDCIMIHPTTQKIALGTGLALAGGAGLVRSGIDSLLPGYFSNRQAKQINYPLAGVSTLAIGAGVFMIYSGITEIYGDTPSETPEQQKASPEESPISNNMCDTDSKLCRNNLGIPRINMPQVEGPATNQFLDHLQSNNVTIARQVERPASIFFATQNELNREKVTGMVKSALAGTFDPCEKEILASTLDYHIIDGHHRWAACQQMGRSMRVAGIDAPTAYILEEASQFPGIKREGFNFFSNLQLSLT